MDWLDYALDGGDSAGVTQVADHWTKGKSDDQILLEMRQRYGQGIPTPKPAPPPVAQPKAPAPAPPSRGDDFLFETPTAPVQSQAQRALPAPVAGSDANAEPDASSWIGRRAQDVMGKTDKRYGNMPTIAEVMIKDKSLNVPKEMWGWLVGASDKDMAGVYKSQLGKRFIRDEEDANGFPIVVYRGADGQEARAYVNKPGLDMQDVMRGVVGIAPNVGAGRLVSAAQKGASLIPRVIGQTMGQGAASVVQDAAGVASGVSDLDLERTATKGAISAAGGAAGEVVGAAAGAIWRKLVTEPRYFNRSAGALTPAGEDAARAAGLDPSALPRDVAEDFASSMARTGDAGAATKQTIANEFKIPRTAGEMTGDTQQLLREQQMTGGGFGDAAAQRMKQFREGQNESIQSAVRGEIAPGQPGIAGQLAPERAGARLGKDELGANIRSNTQAAYDVAKEIENKAWKAVPDDFRAPPEALAAIDEVIPKALAARNVRVIEEGLTPQAKVMSDMIEKFQAGEMPANASKFVNRDLAGHVDIMRRRLLAGMEAAERGSTDERAAKALYDGFNDWVVEAAKMAGDPSIATKMVTARAVSRKIHEVFDGPQGSAGAKIMSNVLKKADSAEGIVNALFSAPSRSEIKGGAITALESLKKSYNTFLPPEAAKAAWDDIRLAYWMRVAEVKTGDVAGAKALASSIKNAINSQATVVKMLYTAEERGRMSRMAALLEDVARKNPNSSWSGISIGAFMKDIGNALLTMLGANSIVGRTAIGAVGRPVQNAYGAARARAATGGGTGASVPALPPPSFGGFGGGVGGQSNR